MNFLDSLMQHLNAGAAPGVAQARVTRTPIFPGAPDPSLQGEFNDNLAPIGIMPLTQRTGLSLGQMFKPGLIQMQKSATPEALPHEIVHAATIGDLTPGSKTYQMAQRALPQQLKDEVPRLWKDFVNTPGFDPVHEGVARFLTSPDYADPKWNKQKQALISSFPGATRAQLTKILASH